MALKRTIVMLAAAMPLAAVLLAAPAHAAPTSPQCFQAESNVSVQENTTANAENLLSNDTIKLQDTKNTLAAAQSAVPTNPVTIGNAQTAVNAAQVQVNTDQASLRTAQRNLAAAISIRDIACNTPAPTPTPKPTPTPTPIPTPTPVPPGPVFGDAPPPSFANCTAAFAAGVSNIPSSDPRYRLYLDRDRDGVACELNGNDGGVVGDPVQFRIIDGKKCHQVNGSWVPVTVVTDPCPTHCPTAAPPSTITLSPPPPVIEVPPAPVVGGSFSQVGSAPVGAAATGDGSLAAAVTPIVPIVPDPDPIDVHLTVDLGDILDGLRLPALPVIPVLPKI